MFRHSTRRWLAVLGVGAALVAGSPVPAVAAGELRILATDTQVAPGYSKFTGLDITLDGKRPEDGTFSVDLDASKLHGLATVGPDPGAPFPAGMGCEKTGETLHCDGPVKRDIGFSMPFLLTGEVGAPVGETGNLVITVRYAGSTAHRTIAVTIAEGVGLEAPLEDITDGEPGTTVGLVGTVRNTGPTTTHGAVLVFRPHRLSPYLGTFRNCTSGGGAPVVCRFDTDLQPDTAYRLSAPLPVHLDGSARTSSLIGNFLDWWTTDDWALVEQNPDSPVPPGKPGTGTDLRLVEDPGQRAHVPQTHVRGGSSTEFSIRVTGDNPADLAAAGWTGTAEVGDKVEVRFGVRNLGPAFFEAWPSYVKLPLVVVQIPGGTTTVTVSDKCAPYSEGGSWDTADLLGKPGYETYACLPTGDLARGERSEYRFTLRVDKLPSATSGVVKVRLDGDPKKANDIAAITITPRTSGQGGGESLPITGSSTGMIAGIGGLLLVAGAGGLLVARRRRTRFVA
ncbi:LPXTG cell wall anchor domain-containing protein [Micromonospora sp. NPDC003776]